MKYSYIQNIFARAQNKYFPFYSVAAIIVAILLIHGEVRALTWYAPETVLIQVLEGNVPDERASCFGDIISEKHTIKKKPLQGLASLYDFIDSRSFFVNTDRGFYLLETGFTKYKEAFEIRIVCYSQNLEGVSYTVINSENQNGCRIRDGGKLVVC